MHGAIQEIQNGIVNGDNTVQKTRDTLLAREFSPVAILSIFQEPYRVIKAPANQNPINTAKYLKI